MGSSRAGVGLRGRRNEGDLREKDIEQKQQREETFYGF